MAFLDFFMNFLNMFMKQNAISCLKTALRVDFHARKQLFTVMFSFFFIAA